MVYIWQPMCNQISSRFSTPPPPNQRIFLLCTWETTPARERKCGARVCWKKVHCEVRASVSCRKTFEHHIPRKRATGFSVDCWIFAWIFASSQIGADPSFVPCLRVTRNQVCPAICFLLLVVAGAGRQKDATFVSFSTCLLLLPCVFFYINIANNSTALFLACFTDFFLFFFLVWIDRYPFFCSFCIRTHNLSVISCRRK